MQPCRVASLKGKRTPLGPYRRPMTRVLGGSSGGGRFLMGEVPLYDKGVSLQLAIPPGAFPKGPRLSEVILYPPRTLQQPYAYCTSGISVPPPAAPESCAPPYSRTIPRVSWWS